MMSKLERYTKKTKNRSKTWQLINEYKWKILKENEKNKNKTLQPINNYAWRIQKEGKRNRKETQLSTDEFVKVTLKESTSAANKQA